MIDPSYRNVATYEPDFLPRGGFPVYRGSVVLEAGQNLKRGSILGRKTANEKFVLCSKTEADGTTAVADGSEKPVCVLQIDVDATDGDKFAPVFRTGSFLGIAMKVGKGYTVDGLYEDLAQRMIFVEKGED